jgi:hypothetical protein
MADTVDRAEIDDAAEYVARPAADTVATAEIADEPFTITTPLGV